jgi:hypothetical protein
VSASRKGALFRPASVGIQRSFMSSMPLSQPEEESHFLLMLGKPGGGKGTISKKILDVRISLSDLNG